MKYDYLVVGSGLYGAIFAHEAKAHGKSVLVVDKRPNIAGNIYTKNIEGINVHKYGAHIFHTNNKKVYLPDTRPLSGTPINSLQGYVPHLVSLQSLKISPCFPPVPVKKAVHKELPFLHTLCFFVISADLPHFLHLH